MKFDVHDAANLEKSTKVSLGIKDVREVRGQKTCETFLKDYETTKCPLGDSIFLLRHRTTEHKNWVEEREKRERRGGMFT